MCVCFCSCCLFLCFWYITPVMFFVLLGGCKFFLKTCKKLDAQDWKGGDKKLGVHLSVARTRFVLWFSLPGGWDLALARN